jgi:hypothetical protein
LRQKILRSVANLLRIEEVIPNLQTLQQADFFLLTDFSFDLSE